LPPVMAAIARSRSVAIRFAPALSAEESGAEFSEYVVLAKSESELDKLSPELWKSAPKPGVLFTDDFTSLIRALR